MIEVRSLTKRYGPVLAVDSLSFQVRPGVVTGFLGPNGSGKSTTMRVMLGLDRPDAGTVTIGGRGYHDLAWPLRTVGALLEAKAFHPGRSARAHLAALAAGNAIRASRVDEVLGLVGLAGAARRPAGKLSLGMGQRLGIAAALLGDPQVLLFDEPVNGLDPEGIRWIRDLMKSLAAEGRAVFVSSHLISEMALTAGRLIVIGRGRLLADTTVADLAAGSRSLEDAFFELTAGSAEFRAQGRAS
jgi:ABC-2 type transport system ATP-binding protein